MANKFQILMVVILWPFHIIQAGLVAVHHSHHGWKLIDDPDTVLEDEELIENATVHATSHVPDFWPKAIVPYTTSANFRPDDLQVLATAIEEYHRHTCVRFKPRTTEKAYINITLMHNLTEVCGKAEVCHRGKPQLLEIRDSCFYKTVVVHELGHSLCLYHEHVRPDREEYVDLSTCQELEEIEPVVNWTTTATHLYDYYSHMHYPCDACVGLPKMNLVTSCGSKGPELGLLDSDKLNYYYNCQGCLRHRWFRAETLTKKERAKLVNFASQDGDTGQVHLCRGYVNGSLVPGTYLKTEKICLVSFLRVMYKIKKPTQLFGLVGKPRTVKIANGTSQKGYAFYSPTDETKQTSFIRVGRNVLNGNIYAAATWFTKANGRKYTVLGRVEEGQKKFAYFQPVNGSQVRVTFGQDGEKKYGILGCAI